MGKDKRKKDKTSPAIPNQTVKRVRNLEEDDSQSVTSEHWFDANGVRTDLDDMLSQSQQTPSHPKQTSNWSLSDNDVKRIAMALSDVINKNLEATVEAKVNERLEALNQEVASLRADKQALEDENRKLQLKVDDLEQYSRRSCLRISGIPEAPNETPDTCETHVLDVAVNINANISSTDIDRAHRVGKPIVGRPRDIIVKLTGYKARRELLLHRSALKTYRLKQVYINEDLTQMRNTLAFQCRKLAKQGKVKQSWTYNGNVYVKDNKDMRFRIYSMEDLHSKFTLT